MDKEKEKEKEKDQNQNALYIGSRLCQEREYMVHLARLLQEEECCCTL